MSSTANLTTDALEVEENTPPFKQLSCYEKLKHIRNAITVEPLLCCYIMPTLIGALAVQNLSLETACRVNLPRMLQDDPSINDTVSSELREAVKTEDLCTKMLINANLNNATAEAEILVTISHEKFLLFLLIVFLLLIIFYSYYMSIVDKVLFYKLSSFLVHLLQVQSC